MQIFVPRFYIFFNSAAKIMGFAKSIRSFLRTTRDFQLFSTKLHKKATEVAYNEKFVLKNYLIFYQRAVRYAASLIGSAFLEGIDCMIRRMPSKSETSLA